jgi:hypothetical protein
MASKKQTKSGVVDAAARIASDLSELSVAFALVGGLAVGARAEPRFTRDVDLAVAVHDDAHAEQVIYALKSRGYSVDTVIEHRNGRLATTRLRHPQHAGVFIDLLFASSGVETEIAARAETIRYAAGFRLPVALTADLLVLKVLSESEKRLQDRIDLNLLASNASPADWKLAEQTARMIRARGFHRGRALVTRLRRVRMRARTV